MSGPLRLMALSFILAGSAVRPALAQDAEPPVHIYEAFYRVGFADMAEFNRMYHEHSVPILEELQDEGVIQGWAQYEHNTGGTYNVRFVVRTWDWESLGAFWEEYSSRSMERMSEADMAAGSEIVQAHEDQVWDLVEANTPADMSSGYLYSSIFQYSVAGQEEWDRIWSEVSAPLLQEAMDAGLLEGWVRLGHNTGGPHNTKILYFFDEWDDMDDFFAMFLGGFVEGHPDAFETISELTQLHDDVIWVPTPGPGM